MRKLIIHVVINLIKIRVCQEYHTKRIDLLKMSGVTSIVVWYNIVLLILSFLLL